MPNMQRLRSRSTTAMRMHDSLIDIRFPQAKNAEQNAKHGHAQATEVRLLTPTQAASLLLSHLPSHPQGKTGGQARLSQVEAELKVCLMPCFICIQQIGPREAGSLTESLLSQVAMRTISQLERENRTMRRITS